MLNVINVLTANLDVAVACLQKLAESEFEANRKERERGRGYSQTEVEEQAIRKLRTEKGTPCNLANFEAWRATF